MFVDGRRERPWCREHRRPQRAHCDWFCESRNGKRCSRRGHDTQHPVRQHCSSEEGSERGSHPRRRCTVLKRSSELHLACPTSRSNDGPRCAHRTCVPWLGRTRADLAGRRLERASCPRGDILQITWHTFDTVCLAYSSATDRDCWFCYCGRMRARTLQTYIQAPGEENASTP